MKKVVIAKIATTTQHGAISGKTQTVENELDKSSTDEDFSVVRLRCSYRKVLS